MTKLFKLLLLMSFLASLSTAQAGVSPLGLSIVPPVELPPQDFTVVGARVSVIYGENYNVYGVDLGAIGNITDQNFVGVGVSGVFNLNKGESTIVGLQAAGLTNINVNKATIVGAQIAAGLNSNQAESSLVGLELGLINYAPFTHIMGLQAGLYNRAHVVSGLQIGLVNVADNLQGIQIGLANINHQGLFAFSPFLNIGF
jgi:hypothetical protein